MNKLREKFRMYIELYNSVDSSDKCEQITDDFSVKFAEWLNIQYRELNHTLAFREKTLTELQQYFKNNIYGKE